MTFDLIHTSQDAAIAERLRQRLNTSGTTSGAAGEGTTPAIVLLSARGIQDEALQRDLYRALDEGRHIIPLLLDDTPLPKEIDHLTPILLDEDADLLALRAALDSARQPEAGLPLKVLTPATRRSNSRAGLVIGLIAFGMFLVGIYGIAILNIEAPLEEFNLVDTEVAQTRDLLLAPTLESYLRYLPGSLEQALEYPATVQAVPTRIRPFVAATATAVAIDQQN
jgi:hypothetical protein